MISRQINTHLLHRLLKQILFILRLDKSHDEISLFQSLCQDEDRHCNLDFKISAAMHHVIIVFDNLVHKNKLERMNSS